MNWHGVGTNRSQYVRVSCILALFICWHRMCDTFCHAYLQYSRHLLAAIPRISEMVSYRSPKPEFGARFPGPQLSVGDSPTLNKSSLKEI